MTAPFKLPAYLSFSPNRDPVLCGADCELVCEMEGVTDDEARHILSAVNERPLMIEMIKSLLDYAESATLEEDDLPDCAQDAERFLAMLARRDVA